ncbi:MAG: AraC family transcriptional regulator [Leptospira sp.]|nr:AraC family transcriptional regulator [Leptospira sp.]
MGESNRVSLWFFVLPFLLGGCGLFIWLFILDNNEFPLLVEVINSSFNTRSFWGWFLVIWIVGPKIVILFYLIPILSGYSKEVFLLYKELKSDMKWYVLAFFPSISVMVFFDAFGYLIGIPFFSRLSAQSHGALVIAVYLFSNYKPETISDISKALETIRYAKSKITGINADSKLQAIDQLMRKESLYADEDFRISQLAEISNLSVHQLCELLNSKLGIGFNEYINRFRIEEAALLLVNEPSRNVISIAFAVGFNSKSAFNKMFRKQYGLTPSEYRKNWNSKF